MRHYRQLQGTVLEEIRKRVEELAEAERETRLGRGRHERGGGPLRRWARSEPAMVQVLWQGFPASVTFLRPGLQTWSYRLKTTNLAEGFFRNLRRFLGRFPGFMNPQHSERALGLYLLGAEMN